MRTYRIQVLFSLMLLLILCVNDVWGQHTIRIAGKDFFVTLNHVTKEAEINDFDHKIDDSEYPYYIYRRKLSGLRGSKGKRILNIPSFVNVNGVEYTIVSIGRGAFADYVNFDYVNIPSTITNIGEYAFFRTSLVAVDIPESVKTIGNRAFGFCEKLKSLKIPSDVAVGNEICSESELINSNSSMSFLSILGMDDSSRMVNSVKPSNLHEYAGIPLYSKYENDYIIPRLKKWQEKDEFETTAQWNKRVTAETKESKYLELRAEAKQNYINDFSKMFDKTVSLGRYDADNGVFCVNTTSNPIYLSVPLKEAQNFKESWKYVKYDLTLGIVNNQLGVVACDVSLYGNKYKSKEITEVFNDDFLKELPSIEELAEKYNEGKNNGIVIVEDDLKNNIPYVGIDNSKTFAVVIGNEFYEHVSSVPYAIADAKVFSEFCEKTLGLPQENIMYYPNASFATMIKAVNDIKNVAYAYAGDINIIFYYAGHGIPNESSRKSYLLPIDADGSTTSVCYEIDKLYDELSSTNAKSIYVFLDACFSGSKRGEGMIASSRGVALKAKAAVPKGNMIVFSAASGSETAYPYLEKGHGMFTYFLLKKIQETKGNVTFGELTDYVIKNVRQKSALNKPQTPNVLSSYVVGDWRELKLR